QRLDGAVERARAEAHVAVGLGGDLAHDAVTVEIFLRKGKQDLKGSRRQRIEFSFWHRQSIVGISIIDYTPLRIRNAISSSSGNSDRRSHHRILAISKITSAE